MIYLEERIRLRRTLYTDWTHRRMLKKICVFYTFIISINFIFLYVNCKSIFFLFTLSEDEVRQLILQLEQDNFDLTKALEDQRSVLSDREKETKQFEKKIRLMNEKYEMLQRSSQSYESQKRQVENEVYL